MKLTRTILAFLFLLIVVSASKRKPADFPSKRGGRGKPPSDLINIDETAGEIEASGNGDDTKGDEETDAFEASGEEDPIEASGEGEFGPIELTHCQMRQVQSVGSSSVNKTKQLLGQFVPSCAPDGQYEIMQCHASTGHCWCVNQLDGRELTGSRRKAPLKPSCAQAVTVPYSTTVGLVPTTERSTASKFIKMSSSHSSANQPATKPTKIHTSVRSMTVFQRTTTTPRPSTVSQRTTTTPRPSTVSQRTTTTPRPSTGVFSSTRSIDPDNEINQIPNGIDADISVDPEPDIDNNYVERPMFEPKARKMTLRSTIIGQPGILAGIISAAVIILLCLVLLIMFCIYRMHRKSQDPAIYYIDKPSTGRSSLPSSNKKAGYMKALDHDVYS